MGVPVNLHLATFKIGFYGQIVSREDLACGSRLHRILSGIVTDATYSIHQYYPVWLSVLLGMAIGSTRYGYQYYSVWL